MSRSHEHTSDVTNPTPSINEGLYYLEYDNPVREDGIRTIGRPERHDYATYYRHQVTMENGSRYLVTITDIPTKYQQASSDVANIETTAWLTQPDGLNKRRMAALAKQAIPTVFVSVQQNRDRFGQLDKNAHNELEILKAMAERYDYDSEHALTNGISRGAMTALAVSSIAKQHDIDIPYTDAIVPCFPRGLNLKRDLAAYAQLLPHEASTLQAIREVPLKYLWRYPKTLDTNLFQQLKEIPTLLSGEVGKQIQQHMDADTFGYVTVYRGDVMSQGSRWQRLLATADYPNMVIATKDGGGHLSCVGNDCFTDWQQRMQTIAEIMHEDPANRALGGTALRNLAAERHPVFRQPGEQVHPLVA